jgi:hypothetical protein
VPSSTTLQFYLARAEQARADAEMATLANVRERCHRCEAAWNELASRAARTAHLRIAEEIRKAGQPPK